MDGARGGGFGRGEADGGWAGREVAVEEGWEGGDGEVRGGAGLGAEEGREGGRGAVEGGEKAGQLVSRSYFGMNPRSRSV